MYVDSSRVGQYPEDPPIWCLVPEGALTCGLLVPEHPVKGPVVERQAAAAALESVATVEQLKASVALVLPSVSPMLPWTRQLGRTWAKTRFFFQNKITTQKPPIWTIFVSTYSKLNVD